MSTRKVQRGPDGLVRRRDGKALTAGSTATKCCCRGGGTDYYNGPCCPIGRVCFSDGSTFTFSASIRGTWYPGRQADPPYSTVSTPPTPVGFNYPGTHAFVSALNAYTGKVTVVDNVCHLGGDPVTRNFTDHSGVARTMTIENMWGGPAYFQIASTYGSPSASSFQIGASVSPAPSGPIHFYDEPGYSGGLTTNGVEAGDDFMYLGIDNNNTPTFDGTTMVGTLYVPGDFSGNFSIVDFTMTVHGNRCICVKCLSDYAFPDSTGCQPTSIQVKLSGFTVNSQDLTPLDLYDERGFQITGFTATVDGEYTLHQSHSGWVCSIKDVVHIAMQRDIYPGFIDRVDNELIINVSPNGSYSVGAAFQWIDKEEPGYEHALDFATTLFGGTVGAIVCRDLPPRDGAVSEYWDGDGQVQVMSAMGTVEITIPCTASTAAADTFDTFFDWPTSFSFTGFSGVSIIQGPLPTGPDDEDTSTGLAHYGSGLSMFEVSENFTGDTYTGLENPGSPFKPTGVWGEAEPRDVPASGVGPPTSSNTSWFFYATQPRLYVEGGKWKLRVGPPGAAMVFVQSVPKYYPVGYYQPEDDTPPDAYLGYIFYDSASGYYYQYGAGGLVS